MKAIAALANGAWLAASFPAWQRFRRGLRTPVHAQQQLLRGLIRDNIDSAYGQQYRFGEIGCYEQFRERVPIVDYEALEPWIARIMSGEQNVLTREPITRLLPTSGSTGARKLIPFTGSLQDEFNAAIGPWMIDLNATLPCIAFGPSYWSISPALPKANEESAIPVGFDDDSAYLGGTRRRLVEATFAVPPALRTVSDLECFRYLTLLCLLRQPELRLVSVWHPSFLTLLLDALPIWWDELLNDIQRGGCARAKSLPAEVRRAMDSSPRPRRALELRRMGPGNPHALWPRLLLVSCWGAGQATLPLRDLQRRFPEVQIQPKGLMATEAFVSVPFKGRHPLAVTSHFFEFEDAAGFVYLANELRTGESYNVIVTTGGGLWRYRLGDLVEVDGWLEATPSLRFLGRGGSVSDLCGEKLSEGFVSRALEEACASWSFTPDFAMLAPETDSTGNWSYTLFIEGTPPTEFQSSVEAQLRKNLHYALCRDLRQLGPLRLLNIPTGAYDVFCRVRISEGHRLGDIKPQNLSPRTDWRHLFRG